MKLPKVITPCPIIETIFEVRFNANCPDDAVFGILYDSLENNYEVENLPIQQIPPAIRNVEAALRHSPHYRLKNGNEILQIGPHVFSLAITGEYPGWITLNEKITEVIDLVTKSPILGMDSLVRVGLRYINYFQETNIFEKASITLSSGSENFKDKQLNVTIVSEKEKSRTRTMIANSAQTIVNKAPSLGSVVDIDVECELSFFKSNYSLAVNEAHRVEKETFFDLIGENYLSEFNPVYEND